MADDIPKGAVVVDDIPAGAVIDDDKRKPSLAERAGKVWDRTKSILGLDEGVLFGGSGEAAGIGGGSRTPADAVLPLTVPLVEGVGAAATGAFKKAVAPVFRDATKLNVPFAGEEMTQPLERDATRLNVPGAGEELPGMASGERWRDATRLNVPYAGEAEGAAPIHRTPFSKDPGASFDLPSTVPERGSIPGAGGEAWSMQRRVTPQLQTAVRAGDPGAVSTAMRLDPTYKPIVIPREAGTTGTSPSQLESIRASSGLFGVDTSTEAATTAPSPISSSGITSPKGNPTPFQGLRPEVQQMTTPGKAAGVPEWVAGQKDYEIQRLKGVLRNPNATEQERAIAQSQLDFHMGNQ